MRYTYIIIFGVAILIACHSLIIQMSGDLRDGMDPISNCFGFEADRTSMSTEQCLLPVVLKDTRIESSET